MDLDTRHIVEQTANFYRMALATGLTEHGCLTRQVSEFQLVVEMEISLPIKFEKLKFALRMGNARNHKKIFQSVLRNLSTTLSMEYKSILFHTKG